METLYNLAKRAIMNLFSDRTVHAETTLTNLRALRDELDILIDTLENQIERQ